MTRSYPPKPARERARRRAGQARVERVGERDAENVFGVLLLLGVFVIVFVVFPFAASPRRRGVCVSFVALALVRAAPEFGVREGRRRFASRVLLRGGASAGFRAAGFREDGRQGQPTGAGPRVRLSRAPLDRSPGPFEGGGGGGWGVFIVAGFGGGGFAFAFAFALALVFGARTFRLGRRRVSVAVRRSENTAVLLLLLLLLLRGILVVRAGVLAGLSRGLEEAAADPSRGGVGAAARGRGRAPARSPSRRARGIRVRARVAADPGARGGGRAPREALLRRGVARVARAPALPGLALGRREGLARAPRAEHAPARAAVVLARDEPERHLARVAAPRASRVDPKVGRTPRVAPSARRGAERGEALVDEPRGAVPPRGRMTRRHANVAERRMMTRCARQWE